MLSRGFGGMAYNADFARCVLIFVFTSSHENSVSSDRSATSTSRCTLWPRIYALKSRGTPVFPRLFCPTTTSRVPAERPLERSGSLITSPVIRRPSTTRRFLPPLRGRRKFPSRLSTELRRSPRSPTPSLPSSSTVGYVYIVVLPSRRNLILNSSITLFRSVQMVQISDDAQAAVDALTGGESLRRDLWDCSFFFFFQWFRRTRL